MIKDAEWNHKSKRNKCIRTNKELQKAEMKTRKAYLHTLISDMRNQYEKQQKEGGNDQIQALEQCFSFKRDTNADFTKIANERFFPSK